MQKSLAILIFFSMTFFVFGTGDIALGRGTAVRRCTKNPNNTKLPQCKESAQRQSFKSGGYEPGEEGRPWWEKAISNSNSKGNSGSESSSSSIFSGWPSSSFGNGPGKNPRPATWYCGGC